MNYYSPHIAPSPISLQIWSIFVSQNMQLTVYLRGIGGKIGWTVAAEATYVGMARRHGVTLSVTLLHCTALQEITAAEKLLNWGFAMDGKVRPAGELVRPLPARTKSAARAASASAAKLPVVPLATGAGAIILVLLGAGWFGLRRRRSAVRAAASAAPSSQDPPQAD